MADEDRDVKLATFWEEFGQRRKQERCWGFQQLSGLYRARAVSPLTSCNLRCHKNITLKPLTPPCVTQNV